MACRFNVKIQTCIGSMLIAVGCILSFIYTGQEAVCAADPEEAAVYEAAQKYLDAEVKRDLKAVFSYLAPSSVYREQNTYETYLAEAESSSVRILEYKILRVHRIQDNHDPKAFPRVEKFAQVEVDLKIYYSDVQKAAHVNYDFTFIKEGGHWYKG